MTANARSQHIKNFLAAHGWGDAALHPLAGDASFRRYIRVSMGARTAMLMDAPPEKEKVEPYLRVAEYLYGHGYSAPEILARDVEAGLLLLEDFGDVSFAQALKQKSLELELYHAAIDVLAEWHGRAHELVNPRQMALPHYDKKLLMNEARLFADWFLPQALGMEKAAALKPEYMALWENILDAAPLLTNQFVHRDYHVDNLMWLPERKDLRRVGLLDFQDGVYGDAAYDAVSLLEDARRDVPEALAQQMLARYILASGAGGKRFMTAYAVLGAQRNSKIIGIFVRLAARDNKHAYLAHLPRVWRYLENNLKHPALKPLKAWLDTHVAASSRGAVAIVHTAVELARTA